MLLFTLVLAYVPSGAFCDTVPLSGSVLPVLAGITGLYLLVSELTRRVFCGRLA